MPTSSKKRWLIVSRLTGRRLQGLQPAIAAGYDHMLYLHDGRARSLEEVLKGPHSPAKVSGKELTETELKTLSSF